MEAENLERLAATIKQTQDSRDYLAAAQEIARKRYESSAEHVKALHERNLSELSVDLKRITPEPKKTVQKRDPTPNRRPEPERPPDEAKAEYVQDQKREAFKAKRRQSSKRTPTEERKSRRKSNNPGYNSNGPTLSR